MDTILYFYKKRDLEKPAVEPVGLKSYMLIRVGLNVGPEEWFGIRLGEEKPGKAGDDEADAEPGASVETRAVPGKNADIPEKPEGRTGISGGLRRLPAFRRAGGRKTAYEAVSGKSAAKGRSGRKKHGGESEEETGGIMGRAARKRRRAAALREQEKLAAERNERIRRADEAAGRLLAEVLRMTEEAGSCHCVYEDSVRSLLTEKRKDGTLSALWERHFDFGEFKGYLQPFWADQLMVQAVLPHFVILGTAPCLGELLEKYARRMKSLRWILPEADCNEELQEFVEDFYTEYGLAVTLEPLTGPVRWKGMRLTCSRPSNILDFTGESGIAVTGLPEGSIWLDMLSVEEKRRRIAVRGGKIAYFSLKEKWKYAQRRCNSPRVP